MRGSKHLGWVLWHEAVYQDGITTLSSFFLRLFKPVYLIQLYIPRQQRFKFFEGVSFTNAIQNMLYVSLWI